MKALVAVGVGALVVAGIAGVAYAASKDDEDRRIWLIKGRRYALAARMTGPGWDASMFPGFCEFSQPTMNTPAGQILHDASGKDYPIVTEVQFTARWCSETVQWDVPSNIAIAEV